MTTKAVLVESNESDATSRARLGIIAGWGIMFFFGFGMIGGQFIPPPGPWPGEDHITAQFYRADLDFKRLAVISLIIGGTMFIPFGAAIADRLRRRGGIGIPLAQCQFGAAVASATLMMVFGPFLLTVMLRPDLPDVIVRFSSLVTWMAWAGLWEPGALQAFSVAVVVLGDKSLSPVFPRWVGWYSLFMAFGSMMGCLIPFFTDNAFAWDGAIAFWVAATNFFVWFAIMLGQFHVTYRRARRSVSPTPPVVGDAPTTADVVEAAR